MTKQNPEKKTRVLQEEQRETITRKFALYELDINHTEEGLKLYKSLIRAKEDTKNDPSYEHVEFRFHWRPSLAVIELIERDPDLWEEWIKYYSIYEQNGFDENLRPSLHRINPKGHYEVGNLAVVPYGEHLKENAVATPILALDEQGNLYYQMFESKSDAQKTLGLSYNVISNPENKVYENEDENVTLLPIRYTRIKSTDGDKSYSTLDEWEAKNSEFQERIKVLEDTVQKEK